VNQLADKNKRIRRAILEKIGNWKRGFITEVAEEVGVSRQTIHNHLKKLQEEGAVEALGKKRSGLYQLTAPLAQRMFQVPLEGKPAEDIIWREQVKHALLGIPANVMDICAIGFTEIFNNAVEHSSGKRAIVKIERDTQKVSMLVEDDGVGIFNHIQQDLGLPSPKDAVLELAKGRLTTAAKEHSGMGIYIVSRMFDTFKIVSGTIFFQHKALDDDWLLEEEENPVDGTMVQMTISASSTRLSEDIYNQHWPNNEGPSKIIVPVSLARYGDDNLVSRSQAKRVMARVQRFQQVVLDFIGISRIGQAFADEIFRVFQLEHPEVTIIVINDNPEVQRMIARQSSSACNKPPTSGTDSSWNSTSTTTWSKLSSTF
jgi:anti-sigma regulatory factor (Ser/Thr protein kinase)